MKLAHFIFIIFTIFSITGCYEKKVCCPIDGGCDNSDSSTDSDSVSQDATNEDSQ